MLKGIGALCIVLSTSFVGFGFAGGVRRQARQLTAVLEALGYLKGEIMYRRTPLAQVLALLPAAVSDAAVGAFFRSCARQMQTDRTRSVQSAMRAALSDTPQLALSQAAQQTLLTLGASLGQFDLDGQCRAIELASARLEAQLSRLEQGRGARCRSYVTIGICAGLAVAVILL